MTFESQDPDLPKRPQLVLLKHEHGLKRRRSSGQERHRVPVLHLIDCRPNLHEAFQRMRWRAPLREHVERFLGRVSARIARKLRR